MEDEKRNIEDQKRKMENFSQILKDRTQNMKDLKKILEDHKNEIKEDTKNMEALIGDLKKDPILKDSYFKTNYNFRSGEILMLCLGCVTSSLIFYYFKKKF